MVNLKLNVLAQSGIFTCVFFVFSYSSSILSKCMLRMQKRKNLIFYDGWKFRRQRVNMIDTTWGHIYFLTCKNVGLSVQWPLELVICSINFMQNPQHFLHIFLNKPCILRYFAKQNSNRVIRIKKKATLSYIILLKVNLS